MHRFTAGLITGGVVGAIGLTYAMRDKKTRKRMVRDGRKMIHKASGVMENIQDMF